MSLTLCGRLPSYRPRVEALEDRAAPASWASWFLASPPLPGSVGRPPAGGKTSGESPAIHVVVNENSSETVLDMGTAFATSGIRAGGGLRLAVLGNTNARLVGTDLSETALTLSYARGKAGSATITVAATDSDGVSAKQRVQVTVRPSSPAGPAYVSPILAGPRPR